MTAKTTTILLRIVSFITWISIGVAVLWLLAGAAVQVKAQDGQHHPAHDRDAHRLFYWYLTRPDIPGSKPGSCCSDGDCYPTPARLANGSWMALRREDKTWIIIPEWRVVKRADELARRPDYQATLCATPAFIYCFVPPEGGV